MLTLNIDRVGRARWMALALALAMLALGAWPPSLPLLDWNRAAILHGQWYRIFSAHLVHLGVWHLLLNTLALLLLGELFWQQLSARKVMALLLASALGVGIGLLLIAPELWRYAGLSGVLHGAWAGSALLLLNQRRDDPARTWWAAALLLLAAKLVWENFGGHSLSAQTLDMPVILPSHALGALSGLTFAGLVWLASAVRKQRPAVAAKPLFD